MIIHVKNNVCEFLLVESPCRSENRTKLKTESCPESRPKQKLKETVNSVSLCPLPNHYENTPIQIKRKFHLQKNENFQIKNSDIFHISAQNIRTKCNILSTPYSSLIFLEIGLNVLFVNPCPTEPGNTLPLQTV